VKRLHLDVAGASDSGPSASGHNLAYPLLERIALVSDEQSSPEDVMTVTAEVNSWLAEQSGAACDTSVSNHL
jgi:hypothetical protein